MATRVTHYFLKDVSATGNGENYILGNKNTNMTMTISVVKDRDNESATVSDASISVYGRQSGSNTFIQLKMMDIQDGYKFVTNGILNKTYYLDLIGFGEIKVVLDSVIGTGLSVIGEVID